MNLVEGGPSLRERVDEIIDVQAAQVVGMTNCVVFALGRSP
jgi:hypothetical protein